ncbi:MAG: L-serine ammonia-lyase, iron-sulfur-dependent, subunit alpha [Actinomycetota bacterium]
MAAALLPSIFNDVIGPVMRGPSSSHSAAAVRIGLLVHDLCDGVPDVVELDYDTEGSLATTHTSQGTDMGLYGGLLGWAADDARLPGAPAELAARGTRIEVRKPTLNDPHPNTYRIHVERAGEAHDVIALSTGGGMIEVISVDGHPVQLFGDAAVTLLTVEGAEAAAALEGVLVALSGADEVAVVPATSGDRYLIIATGQKPLDLDPVADRLASLGVSAVRSLRRVLPVGSRPGMTVPFNRAGELTEPETLDDRPLSDWAIAYEAARGGITEAEVLAKARHILDLMRRGVETGLAGTEYEDRILGWQSGRFTELAAAGALLDGGLLNRMIAYVTALMEAKSAMEVIVAAPTAGACATFPGALLATIDEVEATPEAAERALLTGGLIGVFVTNGSSFAAEVGGCQAETGAGAAMAAAALVELAGGSADRSLSAASQSLQNVLGLICDPVGNRVEAPCLGRNVTGAANALSCANMALAGYDHLIPFDEVVDTHRQVSELMARELRCTGLAGLATTPTAKRIELGLTRRAASTPAPAGRP